MSRPTQRHASASTGFPPGAEAGAHRRRARAGPPRNENRVDLLHHLRRRLGFVPVAVTKAPGHAGKTLAVTFRDSGERGARSVLFEGLFNVRKGPAV